ncbi:DUF4097 family beta strand repeat-containing protein [uncultured Imperialibacter sp.]|uniref:DUF4097 family beta strand repeat-containing protein n=1 Tax=uncultured Imperialibacter sp. TaxID=1672639 RepID=UPI0030D795E9
MKSIALLLFSILVTSSSAISQDFDYSFKETYKVSTPAQLSISSSDGNIEVFPGNSSEIEVFFVVKQNGRMLDISRTQLEEELTLTIIKTGSSVDITVKYPNNSWNIDWRDRINVDFKVYAPKETAGDLRSSDGNVTIKGMTASQKLKTSDGNIVLAEITGDVSGVTSDGNIRGEKIKGSVHSRTSDGNIDFNNVIGDVESTTSDGDIRLTNINGTARAHTSDGDIEIYNAKGKTHTAQTSDGDIYFEDLTGGMEAIASDGSIKGNIIELRGSLRAKTSDGNIEISVPDNLGMNLYVKGESVDVPLVNFSGRSTKEVIDGKTNGGGVDVNLSTSDGRIRLVYR